MAENEATIAENMFLYSPMYYPDYKIAIFDSKLTLLATIGFDTLLMGEILGNLALSQTFDPIAFLYAVINNVLIIGQRDQKFLRNIERVLLRFLPARAELFPAILSAIIWLKQGK